MALPEGRRSESDRQARRRTRRRRRGIGSTCRNTAAADFLIVRVGWTPDRRSSSTKSQNRTQTWLDLNSANRRDRQHETLFRETSKFWIRCRRSRRLPTWLKDGSFLWLSERSGWPHLVSLQRRRHAAQAGDRGTMGSPRTLHGVDEAGGWIYFSGTERSPIGGDVYRIKLDGTGLERLSTGRRARTTPSSARRSPTTSTRGATSRRRRRRACIRATAAKSASSTRTRSRRFARVSSSRNRNSCR